MKFLKGIYHFLMAWLGSVIYNFPSKEIFVLGVTGTKGKSTVLELINFILESAGKKTALLSSVYLKIGDDRKDNLTENTMPGRFFIQRFLRKAVKAKCKYALIEVTSEGVREHRHKFIDFDAACFLNLHPEHIEAHGSYEKYKKAKLKFFSYVARRRGKSKKQFFINQDDKENGYFTDAIKKRENKFLRATRGLASPAQNKKNPAFSVRVYYFSRDYFIHTTLNNRRSSLGKWFANDINLENAAAAEKFAEVQGISRETTKNALKLFKGLVGRMETVQDKPFKVIIDYAHTPDSLEIVYKHLIKLNPSAKGGSWPEADRPRAHASGGKPKALNPKLICVLGSCGGGRDKWKRPVIGKIAAKYCQEIILTNEDPYNENPLDILNQIESGFSQTQNPKPKTLKTHKILDRREAIKKAVKLAKRGDTVIITGKGSERWIHIEQGKKIPWSERQVVEEVLSMK